MAWEQIVKHGTRVNFGSCWNTQPCVVLKKDRIQFNELFAKTFSFRQQDIICVFYDKQCGKIGFKHASSEPEMEMGYVISKETNSKICHISCQRFLKTLPEHVLGTAIVGSMAKGGIMIEITLPPAPHPEDNGKGNGHVTLEPQYLDTKEALDT